MAVDEVRLRVTRTTDSTTDIELRDSTFTAWEGTVTEGTELTILADDAEFEVVYVGDKGAGGEA